MPVSEQLGHDNFIAQPLRSSGYHSYTSSVTGEARLLLPKSKFPWGAAGPGEFSQ